MQALLEAVGCMSFGTPTHVIVKLPRALAAQYCLWVVPDLQQHTMHSDCTIDEIMIQIAKKMSLGDAIQVAQIVKYAPGASCLVTWNAKHFLGKLAIPVLTPAEWLAANP